MQRPIARSHNDIERRDRCAGFDRGGDPIANPLRLHSFVVAEREYIFVEEALLRQGAIEFERIIVDSRAALDRMFKQRPPQRRQ